MKIAIGADHYGFRLKEVVKEHLVRLGNEVHDVGCHDEEPVDYPDVALRVAAEITANTAERGVLVCGTGLGMAITANKVPGVRAASVSDPYSAERLVKSNNAQIICFGGKVLSAEVATLLIDHWLASKFAGGDSARKVAKIEALDSQRKGV